MKLQLQHEFFQRIFRIDSFDYLLITYNGKESDFSITYIYIYIERERVYIYISSSDRFLLYIYENPSSFSVEGMAEALTHTHLRKALLRITAPCPFENFIAAFPPSGVEARSLQNIQAILTPK